MGDTIALVHEGDSITIDAPARLLQLNVSDEELHRHRPQRIPLIDEESVILYDLR